MPAYATQADFEAYVPGWVTDNSDALANLLERATRDIDYVLGPLPIRTSGDFAGLKVDPADLTEQHAEALSRATCAQAIHLFRFVEPAATAAAATGGQRVSRVKGPDFEQQFELTTAPGQRAGATGRYSPELAREMRPLEWLRVTGARARP